MNFKITITYLLLVMALIACAPVSKPVATITPFVTATPFAFDSSKQNISEEIVNYYNSICGSCDKIKTFDFSPYTSRLEFLEVSGDIDFDNTEVQWIADNIDNSYRAYILSEYFCGKKITDCRKNLIYWEDSINQKSYRIEWNNQEIYLYRSVFWIGKNILVIREAAFPGSFVVKGINVDIQEYVYSGLVDNCK